MVKDILISLKQVNEIMSKKIGIKLVVFLVETCWLLHRIARLSNLERKFLRITFHYSYNNDYCQDNCVRPKLRMSGQCCFNLFLIIALGFISWQALLYVPAFTCEIYFVLVQCQFYIHQLIFVQLT